MSYRLSKNNHTQIIGRLFGCFKIVYEKKGIVPKSGHGGVSIKDAFNKRFRSFVTVFIPKLTPKYTKPHIMLHISNGAGSTMIRLPNPDVLVDMLQEIIVTIQSEKWKEAWFEVNDTAEKLSDNQLIMDEELVDINEWKKSLEDTIDIELVAKEG